MAPRMNRAPPAFWELTHVPTGTCVGLPYDTASCTLEDLAALAREMDVDAPWAEVRKFSDLSPNEAEAVKKLITRFRDERGMMP